MDNKTIKFINKAANKHKGKYNYSLVIYIDSYTKIEIICPRHKNFFQSPHHHLSGHGCSHCMTDDNKEKFKLSRNKFIENAVIIHGDKYVYDSVIYVNNRTAVLIYCKKHGFFSQLPTHHLRKSGCPTCGGKEKSNTEEFIEKAKNIHGNKYIYDLVNYINAKTNVIITCITHGNFKITPNDHLSGENGCPKCYKNYSKKQIE